VQIALYCSVIDKCAVFSFTAVTMASTDASFYCAHLLLVAAGLCVRLLAYALGADIEWLPAAAHAIVPFFLTTISRPSSESAAVAMVLLLALSTRQAAQQLPGERVLTCFAFLVTFAHAGCLLLLGETPPAVPQTHLWWTACLLSSASADTQMLVAASVFAKADAYGWGRLRRVLFWAFVFIGSLAFSEGSTVSFVQRLSGHVAFTMREVRAWWRHGYAEGDAFPAPPDLGNLGPALRNDAATCEESLAVSFLFVSHLLHSVETVTKFIKETVSVGMQHTE